MYPESKLPSTNSVYLAAWRSTDTSFRVRSYKTLVKAVIGSSFWHFTPVVGDTALELSPSRESVWVPFSHLQRCKGYELKHLIKVGETFYNWKLFDNHQWVGLTSSPWKMTVNYWLGRKKFQTMDCFELSKRFLLPWVRCPHECNLDQWLDFVRSNHEES